MSQSSETCPECGFRWRDPEALTQREKDVLKALTRDKQNKEIARELGVAVATVEQHRNHLYGKLRVHTAAGAVAKAFEKGLI